jgi:CheY-like chemotaxis protein
MLGGMRILHVEDHGDTRDLYATALRRNGAAVFEAASAQVALILLQRELPDLILMDIELPDADGYALLEAVRKLPVEAGGQTPAVVLSVRNTPTDRAESMKRGCRLHLVKPIEPDELCRVLGGLMKLARA